MASARHSARSRHAAAASAPEECERLAKTMPEEGRRTLLDIAASWRALAAKAERQAGATPKKTQ